MYIHPEYVYYIYNAHSLLPGLSLYATRSLTSLAQSVQCPWWSTGDFSVARLCFSIFFGFHQSHFFTLDQVISWLVYFWNPAFSLGTWHYPVVRWWSDYKFSFLAISCDGGLMGVTLDISWCWWMLEAPLGLKSWILPTQPTRTSLTWMCH